MNLQVRPYIIIYYYHCIIEHLFYPNKRSLCFLTYSILIIIGVRLCRTPAFATQTAMVSFDSLKLAEDVDFMRGFVELDSKRKKRYIIKRKQESNERLSNAY